MADTLRLIGFNHSVYTRIVRGALHQMKLSAQYQETNPFERPIDPILAEHSVLGRVPVLIHGNFVLTETTAILRYLDQISVQHSLIPQDVKRAAKMDQIIGIVDSYAYWPWVRQVFSHAVYRPALGMDVDPRVIVQGLENSRPALAALDGIAAEKQALDGDRITLADLHLGPIMAYFLMAPQGAEILPEYPSLNYWWQRVCGQSFLTNTDSFTPHPDTR